MKVTTRSTLPEEREVIRLSLMLDFDGNLMYRYNSKKKEVY
jgi:hypothetical protein